MTSMNINTNTNNSSKTAKISSSIDNCNKNYSIAIPDKKIYGDIDSNEQKNLTQVSFDSADNNNNTTNSNMHDIA
jgi:hypothetical protein